jgi:NAD(P)-dependent dehydrogenase (short-subunit alcohol dehydrogenase family)
VLLLDSPGKKSFPALFDYFGLQNIMRRSTMSLLTHRPFCLHTLAVFSLAALLICGCRQAPNPSGGPFGKESTGEEVTQGLDLTGKTILITGVNSGLGYETMRVLAMRGAHIIGLARTMEKAQEACARVGGKTTPVACELTDFNSVVAAAETVKALGIPIDVLICNAGIMEVPKLEQVYGMEKQFVVNYLGHFILVNRLLGQVKAAEQGRIVMVSSGRYTSAPPEGIQFDNLSGEKGYDPLTAYGQSKLALALFAQELARRLEGSNVTSNSVLPGVIMTNLGRYMPSWKIMVSKLMGWTFMRSVEQGVATTCYVATRPELAGITGQMFFNCASITPEGSHMSDRALAAKLWDVSTELTKDYR